MSFVPLAQEGALKQGFGEDAPEPNCGEDEVDEDKDLTHWSLSMSCGPTFDLSGAGRRPSYVKPIRPRLDSVHLRPLNSCFNRSSCSTCCTVAREGKRCSATASLRAAMNLQHRLQELWNCAIWRYIGHGHRVRRP